jgi:predicted ATPase/signal transduction histidine kinase/tRNA A-37 threonylcarbamoyl transferase component Bud32
LQVDFEQVRVLSAAGFELRELLREGRRTVVYRGRRIADSRPVVLKCLRPDHSSNRDLARLRREHEIISRFDDDAVVRAVGLERIGNGLALVLEDFGGVTLRDLIRGEGVDLHLLLRLAIRLVDALAVVHAAGVIHKDIKPDNILIDRNDERLALADFSVSSYVAEEAQGGGGAVIEGTLQYMSPEQTGRMNRSVDYRSDFYSVGVTLYHAATGRLPFEGSDPMELVHAHIARVPLAPSAVAPRVPEGLSRLILRLMAKTAEGRYQSLRGIRADLSRCLSELTRSGTIAAFDLGAADVSERFTVPERLYGREESVRRLLDAFERVSQGTTEIMLLTGPSGVGKSAVIHEVHKPIVQRRGHFIAGKFDQFNRDIPYASLLQALQQLVQQLLSETDASLAAWRDEIRAVLGANGQVAVDVLPDLGLIIGPQPPTPPLPPTESANRFRNVFRGLLGALAREHHPLVIFLDDLQWSDLATLKLIELISTDPDSRYILWLGAYRDNEVDSTHLLSQTLRAVEDARVVIHRQAIRPLSPADTATLVADTLAPSRRPTAPLAEIVHSKTDGNPFFVRALLRSFYEQGIIAFSPAEGAWSWDDARLHAVELSDDVVELMVARIDGLGEGTRRALQIGACLGNQFELLLLARLVDRDLAAVAADLWAAVERGLIRPLGDGYKYITLVAETDQDPTAAIGGLSYQFLHDKIQQAAHTLLSDAESRAIHLRIGRMLAARAGRLDADDSVFAIANHLNLAAALITEPAERRRLAEINLLAGQRAKQSIAYEAAVTYLRGGVACLPADAWEAHYPLAFALFRERIEAENLAGGFEEAMSLFVPLLAHARSDLEKADLHALKAALQTGAKHNRAAIDTSIAGLRLLGINLPAAGTIAGVLRELGKVQWSLRGRRAQDLMDLPELTDPKRLIALKLLIAIVPAAYFIDAKLVSIILLQIAHISLRYGLSDVSAFGFAGYGLVLSGALSAHETAYEFGRLALQLNEHFRNPWLDAKLDFMVGTFMASWVRPFPQIGEQLQRAYQVGLAGGDLTYACYGAAYGLLIAFVEGQPAERLQATAGGLLPLFQRAGEADGHLLAILIERLCLCLRRETQDPVSLSGGDFDEQAFLATLSDERTPATRFYHRLYKALLLYLFGHYNAMQPLLRALERSEELSFANPMYVDFYLLDVLSAAALHPDVSRSGEKRISRGVRKLERLARLCPANFESRYLLCAAERARAFGEGGAALALYNRAIQSARDHGARHIEALAFECAGRAALAAGQRLIAGFYLGGAISAYRRWGGLAKVDLLISEHRELLPPHVFAQTNAVRATPFTSTGTASIRALDVGTVIKASQAISSEIVLDKLLRRLVVIVMENAGARRCVLLLEREGRLYVEAEASVDPEQVTVMQGIPVESAAQLPTSLINYVSRARRDLVLDDASIDGTYADDPYIAGQRPRSILCTPILHQGNLTGVLYLEHGLASGVFNPERLELLRQIAAQAAISVENARLYRNLDQARDEAVAADRAKTRFLMSMSHELRTPLNAVIGYTDLIAEEMEDGDIQALRADLHKIKSSATRLLRTLSGILELSRLESGKLQLDRTSFDLEGLIAEIQDEVREVLEEHNNSLSVVCPPSRFILRTDRSMLHYALLSLMDNAARFTEGGEIRVHVDDLTDAHGSWVRVAVSDSGIGISDADLARIFASFSQLDDSPTRSHEGAGVSLAVTQRFCAMLGGSISVRSAIGRGSTFTILIPDAHS